MCQCQFGTGWWSSTAAFKRLASTAPRARRRRTHAESTSLAAAVSAKKALRTTSVRAGLRRTRARLVRQYVLRLASERPPRALSTVQGNPCGSHAWFASWLEQLPSHSILLAPTSPVVSSSRVTCRTARVLRRLSGLDLSEASVHSSSSSSVLPHPGSSSPPSSYYAPFSNANSSRGSDFSHPEGPLSPSSLSLLLKQQALLLPDPPGPRRRAALPPATSPLHVHHQGWGEISITMHMRRSRRTGGCGRSMPPSCARQLSAQAAGRHSEGQDPRAVSGDAVPLGPSGWPPAHAAGDASEVQAPPEQEGGTSLLAAVPTHSTATYG